MPIYDYVIDGKGLRRFQDGVGLDELCGQITSELRLIDFKKLVITIKKRRGTPP